MGALCLADVQRAICAQHREIRARLLGLLRSAEAEEHTDLRTLRTALLRFSEQFEAHLLFEERELLPLVRRLDAWGSVREEAIIDEHRAQRTRVEDVCVLAEHGARGLGGAVRELAAILLADIVHEEAALEELAEIDEQGHVDQIAG